MQALEYASHGNSHFALSMEAQLRELKEQNGSGVSLTCDDFADAQGYQAWAQQQQAELGETLRVINAAPSFCGHLSVEIINADGFSTGQKLLPCATPGSHSRYNPYCVVWIKGNKFHGNKGTQTQKTHVLNTTSSPRWNQKLPGFRIFHEDCVLRLQVSAARRIPLHHVASSALAAAALGVCAH